MIKATTLFVIGMMSFGSAQATVCDDSSYLSLHSGTIGTIDQTQVADGKVTFVSRQVLEAGIDHPETNGKIVEDFMSLKNGVLSETLAGKLSLDFGIFKKLEIGKITTPSHYQVINGKDELVYKEVPVLTFHTSKNCGYRITLFSVNAKDSEDMKRHSDFFAERIGLTTVLTMETQPRQATPAAFVLDPKEEEGRPKILIIDATFAMFCASPSKHAFCKN